MSTKSELKRSIHRVLARLRDAHGTRTAREVTVRLFTEFVAEANYQLRCVEHVRVKHVTAFIDDRREDGLSKHYLQNQLSHLRVILRAAGRGDVADSDELSCKALEIDDASRAGTNAPIGEERLQEVVASASHLQPGLALCFRLSFHLGLRGREAVMCAPDLGSWEQSVESEGRVVVFRGTKGKRERVTFVPHSRRQGALQAIRDAKAIAARNGGNLLFGNLKKALGYYHRHAHNLKIKPHGLRYAFAHALLDGVLEERMDLNGALRRTALSLGHGDGRWRWLKSVYLHHHPMLCRGEIQA